MSKIIRIVSNSLSEECWYNSLIGEEFEVECTIDELTVEFSMNATNVPAYKIVKTSSALEKISRQNIISSGASFYVLKSDAVEVDSFTEKLDNLLTLLKEVDGTKKS